MAEFIFFSIVIICLFCYYYPQIAKKTFIWLFVILPITLVLYTFEPMFLAIVLGAIIIIGAFASVDKNAKSFKLSMK